MSGNDDNEDDDDAVPSRVLQARRIDITKGVGSIQPASVVIISGRRQNAPSQVDMLLALVPIDADSVPDPALALTLTNWQEAQDFMQLITERALQLWGLPDDWPGAADDTTKH